MTAPLPCVGLNERLAALGIARSVPEAEGTDAPFVATVLHRHAVAETVTEFTKTARHTDAPNL
jgi:hypothetical protein